MPDHRGDGRKKSPFGNSDSLNVWIPYTSAMSRLLGQNYFSSITVRVRDGLSNAIAEQGILKLLTAARHPGCLHQQQR